MYNGNILRSWILFFLRIIPLVQALSITVPDQAQANVPTRVAWSLNPGDPAQWDFRFVKDGKDVGLAAANVKAGTAQNGESVVVFPGVGNFVIAAVAGPDHNIIGQSLTAQVVNASSSSSANPTSTSTSTSPSVSITTIIPSATLIKAQSKPNIPAIVGGVLGTLIFLLLLILLYLLRRRNRFHTKDHAHPEMSDPAISANGKRKSWLQRLTSKNANAPREVEGRGGPRAPKPSTPLPRTVIIRPPITARQQMIDNQIASLLEELTEIQREGELGRMRDSRRTSIVNAGTSLSTGAGALTFNTGGVISMGEVGVWKTEAERKERERERAGKVENVWKRIKALREMKNSEWALGDCDETPEILRESGML